MKFTLSLVWAKLALYPLPSALPAGVVALRGTVQNWAQKHFLQAVQEDW